MKLCGKVKQLKRDVACEIQQRYGVNYFDLRVYHTFVNLNLPLILQLKCLTKIKS